MYTSSGQGRMGCSVAELCGMGGATPEELKKLLGGGVTLCVTSGYQHGVHKTLRDAGFVPVIDYKNRAFGHSGNKCRLWAATKGKSRVFMPEGDELLNDNVAVKAITVAAEKPVRKKTVADSPKLMKRVGRLAKKLGVKIKKKA